MPSLVPPSPCGATSCNADCVSPTRWGWVCGRDRTAPSWTPMAGRVRTCSMWGRCCVPIIGRQRRLTSCAGMPKSSPLCWLRSGVDVMRILVADDDADLRALIGFTLMQAGFDICTAVDGESALQAFQRDSPDMVLLDINMPEPNGLQVCREIRGRSPVPIMMLTVRDVEE